MAIASKGADVLLLTATIRPRAGTYALSRAKADDRLNDYLRSMEFYGGCLVRNPDWRMVFVENSGADLTPIVDAVDSLGISDQVEFVSYEADDPADRSRFYLEGRLLQEALAQSQMLAAPGARIWKITGRYIIRNLERVVETAPEQFDIYINCRNYPESVVDFYIVGFSATGLARVVNDNLDAYDSQVAGEQILRRYLDAETFSDLEVERRFRTVPHISGVRGFDGKSYDSLNHQIKFQFRVVMNRLMPSVWV